MLRFSLRRVFAARGIMHGLEYLVKNGFTRASAVNMYNFEATNVKIKNLEKLCRSLNCTPNDFFEWRPGDGETPIDETHALNALRREKAGELNRLMREIPLEKLTDVEDFLRDLKSKI